ncbi:hypothetical protein BDN67DRAFT_984411 [Paxillus ammoniavirescens]|nr:hypothetical protein BDN67DRAFT_984411 [Paxillus ammoniavirescens]
MPSRQLGKDSPTPTESSLGDHTIQMSSFMDVSTPPPGQFTTFAGVQNDKVNAVGVGAASTSGSNQRPLRRAQGWWFTCFVWGFGTVGSWWSCDEYDICVADIVVSSSWLLTSPFVFLTAPSVSSPEAPLIVFACGMRLVTRLGVVGAFFDPDLWRWWGGVDLSPKRYALDDRWHKEGVEKRESPGGGKKKAEIGNYPINLWALAMANGKFQLWGLGNPCATTMSAHHLFNTTLLAVMFHSVNGSPSPDPAISPDFAVNDASHEDNDTESLLSVMVYDLLFSNPSSEPHLPLQVRFNRLIFSRATGWCLLSLDCFKTICLNTFISKIGLDMLSDSSLQLGIKVIANMVSRVLVQHRVLHNDPTWEPLEGIPIIFLTHIWHCMNHLLTPAPMPRANSNMFPRFLLVPRHDTPQGVRDTIHNLLKWNDRVGYWFWHDVDPATNTLAWFKGRVTRDHLYHVIINNDSVGWFGVVETIVHPYGTCDGMMPTALHALEKVSFALAWVVQF